MVVTGIGLNTGLGLSTTETWANLIAGRHAFRELALPHATGAHPHVGCPLAGGPALSTGANLLRVAAAACSDARLGETQVDKDRVGVAIGMSKGDLAGFASWHRELSRDRGDTDVERARGWLASWPNAAASSLAAEGGFRGPCLAPIAACATGLVAALQGVQLIRRGVCDVVLAGAGDSSLDPLVLGAFRRMGVLAAPGLAVRPWDRLRSGFLVGEGAAVLVLERDDRARARGMIPYAELAGGAFGADAYHMTDLDPDPSGLAHVIRRAMTNAGVPAEEIDHVNVHGTATRSNDPLECRAIRLALGARADRVACSANKSQIGHLLGAAGAVELAITCLSIHERFMTPTLNLTDPDPACDLDGTPLVGRHREIVAALKLSIGFGGHLAAAVLRRCEGRRDAR